MATTNKGNSKDSSASKNKESSSSSVSSSTKEKFSTTVTKNNKENQLDAGKAENEQDKYKKFENEGVVFKAKLIGSELVMEPRGDKMCQNSIQRLKAIIKGTNSHKKRIVLKISYDGVKVFDEKTNEILHHHEVAQISYIASDDTDNRTFGYVSDVPNKAHQFICFKTSGPAINVMSVISALFEAVLEKKNQAEKEKQESTGGLTSDKQDHQDSIDLIGDSGIVDADSSFASIDKITSSQSHLPLQQSNSSTIFENNITSPGNSFNSNSNGNNSRNKQSASSDLLFDDLFAGLSDPIIVDKNDSLISYKQQNKDTGAKGVLGGGMSSAPVNFYPPRQPATLHSSASANMVPSSTTATTHAHPIPQRQHSTQQHPTLLPPPSSLPMHHAIMMANTSSSGPGVSMSGNMLQNSHNRSLVYNHSSLSLSDAPAFSNRTSYNQASSGQNQNDSYVDRYAVFNDIDNLPSIFESASLGSVNNVGAPVTSGNNSNIMQSSTHDQQFGARSYHNNQGSAMLNSAGFGGSTTGVHSFNNAQSSMNSGVASKAGASGGVIRSGGGMGAAGGLGRSTSTTTAPDVDIFRQSNPFDDDFFA